MKNRFTFALAFWIAVVLVSHSGTSIRDVQAQSLPQQPSQLLTVPRQPVTIIPLGNRLHVLSNRVDANFNGQQDAGDSAAAWAVFDLATLQPLQLVRFAWESVNVQRVGIDPTTQTLFVSRAGRISSYNMQTLQLLRDTVAPFSASAVSYVPLLQTLILSRRPNFTDPGSVLAYNTLLNAPALTAQAGVNVQQTIAYTSSRGEVGVAVLNEGNFGRPTSTVQLLLLNPLTQQVQSMTSLNVGDTGNHLFQRGDSIFVTANGSHQVHIIDLNSKQIVRTIATGTSGFNGPRESVADGDILYVTTFSNDVRRFRISTGAPITPLLLPQGRPEGLALANNRLFVANAFQSGSFTSATSVAVFDLLRVSVGARSLQAAVNVFPNPTSDEAQITLRFDEPLPSSANGSNGVTLKLVNALGTELATVPSTQTDASTLQARISAAALNLASGQYFVHVRTASGIQALPITVRR